MRKTLTSLTTLTLAVSGSRAPCSSWTPPGIRRNSSPPQASPTIAFWRASRWPALTDDEGKTFFIVGFPNSPSSDHGGGVISA